MENGKTQKNEGRRYRQPPFFIALLRQTRLLILKVENITQACRAWSTPEKDSLLPFSFPNRGR